MKKINEGFKPFFPIIFGTILLLTYLNFLNNIGGQLVLGIISLIFAIYYIAMGVLMILAKEKLAKYENLLSTIGIVLYPIFLFTYYLIVMIQGNKILELVGWIIAIAMMIVSLGSAILILLSYFVDNNLIKKLAQFFGLLLAVMILVTLLFDELGVVIVIGNIVPVILALKCIYCLMLYNELGEQNNFF